MGPGSGPPGRGLGALAVAALAPADAGIVSGLVVGPPAPTDLATGSGWAVVRQAVTAQLRHALGLDLGTARVAGPARAFPRAVAARLAVPSVSATVSQ